MSRRRETPNHNAFGANPFSDAHRHHSSQSANEDQNEERAVTSIPSTEVMQSRWAFRERIRRETSEHRRVMKHKYSGRNIAAVLFDRERFGTSHLSHEPRRRRLRPHSRGDRSPSTVFESPIVGTASPERPSPPQVQESPESPESIVSKALAPDESKLTELTQEVAKKQVRFPFPLRLHQEIRFFAESCSATRYHSAFLHHLGGNDEPLDAHGQRPSSSPAVSTISVAFSPDSHTVASTHGDHTVKISCCHTGRLLHSLEGHPRTPWTVKYHPTRSEILASGCLGHQVRVWNWKQAQLLQMVRLEYAIISLSFHPQGNLLAVANGTRLHFWGVNCDKPNGETPSLMEFDQRHMLRCVHFPPSGKTLILGGVNNSDEARRRSRSGIGSGGMSFYLRLWDFNLEKAREGGQATRGVLSNPRTFVPRALLYNDGGFDVSPDGKTLCACAEYWLPEGVDNAMELLYKEEAPYGVDDENDIESGSCGQSAQQDVSPSGSGISSDPTRRAVTEALSKLRGVNQEDSRGSQRSPSCQDGGREASVPRTPPVSAAEQLAPMTPPNPAPRDRFPRLSPPPPPTRRFIVGAERVGDPAAGEHRNFTTPPPPPPPPGPPQAPGGASMRPPHPLSVVSKSGSYGEVKGRYVPHVVTVSLDTDPIPEEVHPNIPRGKPYGAVPLHYRPRLGQLLEACPLDSSKASAVTCVKFSPSTDYCLIGYGVREPHIEGGGNFHPVTALYRVRGGMTHVSTMLSGDDDVNIARFHPDSGYGFVYGTKQGRVRVLSPRPWNYYD